MNINKTRFFLSSLFLSMTLSSAYAWDDAHLNKIAHPPYRIKPNTPLTAPSGLSPAQIQKIYGLNLISQKGEGQIIAIIDAYDNPNAEADLNVFSSTFNLPACTTANGCFQKVFPGGTQPAPDARWAGEISLDVQWAHALAPNAKIMLVEAADSTNGSLLAAIKFAVQHGANIVSMSFGSSESPNQSQYDTYFNIPNVSFIASTGDAGNEVNWPAVSAYVLSAGGTSLTVDASGNYQNETAWPSSGGGVSLYTKIPSYQANFANKNNPNNMRGVPDVAFNSDANVSGVSVYESYGSGGWVVMGGTSAASPAWAGINAVANSASKNPLNNFNKLIYNVAATPAGYSANFHDVLQGSNGSCGPVCTAGQGYDYITGLGSPQAQNLIKALAGSPSDPCTRAAPTVTYTPNTAQYIQQNGSITISIDLLNNDSAVCPSSTFNLNTITSSNLIKSALTTSSLVVAPGSKMTTYMITKASNVAQIGALYTTTVNVVDIGLNRPTSFNTYVVIGNSLASK